MKTLSILITLLCMSTSLFGLSKGQTQEQVIAELGREPDSRMTMGAREVWTYKESYKITFERGIVTKFKAGPDTVYTTTTTEDRSSSSRPSLSDVTNFVSDNLPGSESDNQKFHGPGPSAPGQKKLDTSDSFEALDSLPSRRYLFYLILPLASILAGILAKKMVGI